MANREVYMDHVRQNFWKEMVHKEELLRSEWHLKYSAHLAKPDGEVGPSAMARKRRSGAVPRPNSAAAKLRSMVMEEEAHRASRQRLASTGGAAQALSSAKTQTTGLSSMEPMRPPSATTHALLYDGLSHEGKGRYAYLSRRKRCGPEERYEYPLTYALDYGWKVKDNMRNMKKSEHGRGCIVRDSFYRPRGVF